MMSWLLVATHLLSQRDIIITEAYSQTNGRHPCHFRHHGRA